MANTPKSKLAASAVKVRVGAQLALARESLGWSQTEMVRTYAAAGLSTSKLSQWEAGIHYPDPYFLTLLCNDHGFTMDWFYRGVRAGVSVERADDLRRAETERSAA